MGGFDRDLLLSPHKYKLHNQRLLIADAREKIQAYPNILHKRGEGSEFLLTKLLSLALSLVCQSVSDSSPRPHVTEVVCSYNN